MSVEGRTVVPVEQSARLAGVDRLRVALTVGVIATHAVITNAGNGSWFYHEGRLAPALETAAAIPLALAPCSGWEFSSSWPERFCRHP